MELLNRIKAQGTQQLRCREALSKRHEKRFASFAKTCDGILSELVFST